MSLEDVYTAELLRYPAQWAFRLPRAGIILVSDDQLDAITDPDREIDLSISPQKRIQSLRQVCQAARERGARTLIVAFDHFWSQYRPGQGHEPRKLMPDTDEYIERVAKISATAQEYGLGLELSVVSPLELGTGYRRATGETGRWLHYREGVRDPKTGRFSIALWQHERWGNNKGAFTIDRIGVRAFAFSEEAIHGTHLFAVSPESLSEVSDGIEVDEIGPVVESGDLLLRRIVVSGSAPADGDRVLVALAYRTPEMDYFSEHARPFLCGLLDRYHSAGVKLNGLYSDEMHIQQDWNYFNHHEHGQFALRYVSDGFAKRFADTYGDKYRDLDPYMITFCIGQHDYLPSVEAIAPAQHVFGRSVEDIHQTYLFRSRYYRMLEGGVVDLMAGAKRYAEELAGHTLEARAHVTWAESPTIDRWDQSPLNEHTRKYEYTPDFVWSNTVQQAASACQDYFRWNDYLTGGGNDHAEGGYADRDYFALALGCSTGVLNDVPYAYAAHWGMPKQIAERRQALVDAYGASASPPFAAVEDSQHRDVDVLMLYPIDLVAVDERFGSWMVQYGYANYITAEKLLAEGSVTEDGRIRVRNRTYSTLCALFEPLPSCRLLDMMQSFVDAGGRVIWSGPPPVLTAEGGDATALWTEIFGARYTPTQHLGLPLPGRKIDFAGVLESVDSQTILSALPVDAVYPLTSDGDTQVVATCAGRTVGTYRANQSGGSATVLGFRPRDDQSASLGEEVRTWFEVLAALGAYPSTTADSTENDNTEYVSRTSPFVCCRFPNGTTTVAMHFRSTEEGWTGGFHRDDEADAKWLVAHPLPSDRIELRDFRVNGHRVTYDGRLVTAFRVQNDRLIAFAGYDCAGITIDGVPWRFADQPQREFAFAPIPAEQRVDGGARLRIRVVGEGVVRVPHTQQVAEEMIVIAEGVTPGARGDIVPATIGDDYLELTVTQTLSGQWLYVVV